MDAASKAPQSPSDSLQAGDHLGRYQLLCPIARGGMGQVWAARQAGRLGLPKLVAIKIAIPLEASSYREVQEYLFDEAQVAASVDHPNVCKILELGQERDVLFIAMEWLNGAPLSTLVSKLPHRRLDVRMAAYLVAQACSGLHAAHELTDDDGQHLEVVHRDATPHNLLITSAGEVKVMDFGIVKSKNQQHQATQTGELKGKLSYLAPELIRGKSVDRRADIFTLGVVLYVITVGRGPFNPSSGQDAGQTLLRILDGEYAAPSSLVPGYPPELEAIVRRALAPKVDDRYPTAEDMRQALEEFLANGSRPVTREEVAALLANYCGPSIEQRRQEIRTAQKLFDSQAGQARSGTFPAGEGPLSLSTPIVPVAEVDPASRSARTLASESHAPLKEAVASRAPSKSRAFMAAGAGLLGVAVLGGALWLGTRSAAESASAVSVTPPAGTAPPTNAVRSAIAEPAAALAPAAPATIDIDEPSPAADAAANAARARAARRWAPRDVARQHAPAAPQNAPAPSSEPRPVAESNAFSQSVSRKPARHAIDENDPFAK